MCSPFFYKTKLNYMPNWCNNNLLVEGNLDALTDFKKKTLIVDEDTKELRFTMEGIYPTPKPLLEQTSPVMWKGELHDEEGQKAFEAHIKSLKDTYGFEDWYSWRVANWGTKWDCDTFYVNEHDGDCLEVNYSTAWSPNEGFIKFASQVYPSLKFRLAYEEAGMGFAGVLICENGEVVEAVDGDLEYKDEDTDRLVTYDSELERYRYVDTNEVIDDEDFSPIEHNPFI